MQCNTPGLCLIRARGTAARIIHRRRNNFNKSGHGPAIHESPPRQTRKSRPRVGGGGRGGGARKLSSFLRRSRGRSRDIRDYSGIDRSGGRSKRRDLLGYPLMRTEAARERMRTQRGTRRDGSFISDGGFRVAGCEITSIGETLMGSACPPDVVKQGRPSQATSLSVRIWETMLEIPSSDGHSSSCGKSSFSSPSCPFPAACPDPALRSISMSSYWSFRHAG